MLGLWFRVRVGVRVRVRVRVEVRVSVRVRVWVRIRVKGFKIHRRMVHQQCPRQVTLRSGVRG